MYFDTESVSDAVGRDAARGGRRARLYAPINRSSLLTWHPKRAAAARLSTTRARRAPATVERLGEASNRARVEPRETKDPRGRARAPREDPLKTRRQRRVRVETTAPAGEITTLVGGYRVSNGNLGCPWAVDRGPELARELATLKTKLGRAEGAAASLERVLATKRAAKRPATVATTGPASSRPSTKYSEKPECYEPRDLAPPPRKKFDARSPGRAYDRSPRFATAFEMTAPVVQRCENYRRRTSSSWGRAPQVGLRKTAQLEAPDGARPGVRRRRPPQRAGPVLALDAKPPQRRDPLRECVKIGQRRPRLEARHRSDRQVLRGRREDRELFENAPRDRPRLAVRPPRGYRIAAVPRSRRGFAVVPRRGDDAAAATRIVRGTTLRRRRGRDAGVALVPTLRKRVRTEVVSNRYGGASPNKARTEQFHWHDDVPRKEPEPYPFRGPVVATHYWRGTRKLGASGLLRN